MAKNKNPYTVKSMSSRTMSEPGNKSAGIFDDYAERKNVATKEGTIEKVPVDANDIANKAYVDSLAAPLWQRTASTLSPVTSGDKIQIETADASDPEITFKTTNTAHQIDMHMDEGAINDDLDIHGRTAGVATEVCVHALDGENAVLRLYSGTAYSTLAQNSNDDIKLINLKIDKDLILQTNSGGVSKMVTFNGSANEFNMGDTDIVTTGNVDGLDLQAVYSSVQAVVASAHSNTNDAHVLASTHSNTTDHTQNTDTILGASAVALDHGTAASDMITNICYGTSATPPTANTTTEGSLYIQYTA